MRQIGEYRKATVPVFCGYSNVAFPANTSFTVPQGTYMSFNENFISILPQEARPASTDGELSAFVYKGDYAYSFEFQTDDEKRKWPKEFEETRKKLDIIDEDIQLAISLSCKRTPPVSMIKHWTIIFDPLSQGISLSWRSAHEKTTSHHKCNEDEIKEIEEWCNIIHGTEDSKIRLAIRKLISAISQRINPIDGLIDSIISWENLFGKHAELGFRISSAIACLLEKDKAKTREFQKKLKNTYNTRSSIVHGGEISSEEASKFRGYAIDIGLRCLSELYKNHPKLISDDDRALTILLEHE